MLVSPLPRLNVILDRDVAQSAGWTIPDLAHAYLAGGARFLQVRAKHLGSGPYAAECDEVLRLARPSDAIVVINDRTDLARLCGAAGVHLGQTDLEPRAARRILNDTALIGLSTHSPEQIRAALAEPVDYIAVGPVFTTATKQTGSRTVGLELIREAAALAGAAGAPVRPVVAIGGITLDRARSVIDAGATSVAVISDLLSGGDPERRVREYLRVLEMQTPQ